MTPLLALSHIEKWYPQTSKKVLTDISISAVKGEFISLIGPSGCGKSTLLSIIAGIEQQTSGEILFNSTVTKKRTGLFGYMPQKDTLLPWKTVLENVALGLEVRGIARQERENSAMQLLHHFSLDAYATYYPHTLSGGMAQRIAFLRTLLFNQEFLLLDEPFGALDALTRSACQQWLLQVWNQYHSTVLFVTHDIREAIFLSDRVCVMGGNGNILANIAIRLSRPRRQQHLFSKPALALEKRLQKLLEGL